MAKGNRVCQNCGIEVEANIIDEAYEKRAFSSDSGTGGHDNSRVGGTMNPLLEDFGLDTNIIADSGLSRHN